MMASTATATSNARAGSIHQASAPPLPATTMQARSKRRDGQHCATKAARPASAASVNCAMRASVLSDACLACAYTYVGANQHGASGTRNASARSRSARQPRQHSFVPLAGRFQRQAIGSQHVVAGFQHQHVTGCDILRGNGFDVAPSDVARRADG